MKHVHYPYTIKLLIKQGSTYNNFNKFNKHVTEININS